MNEQPTQCVIRFHRPLTRWQRFIFRLKAIFRIKVTFESTGPITISWPID